MLRRYADACGKNSPLLSDNIAQILLKDFIAPQMNKGNREDALVFYTLTKQASCLLLTACV